MNIRAVTFPNDHPHYIWLDKGNLIRPKKREKFKLITKFIDKRRYGYMVCNTQYDFPIETRENDYIGDYWINCNTIHGDSYAVAWLEFEHNAENRDMYVQITIGAYREACYGTTYLLLGRKIDSEVRLTAIGTIPYTMLNPGEIILYGRFPYPRFIIGGYHYCPFQLVSVTGVRIKRVRMWV